MTMTFQMSFDQILRTTPIFERLQNYSETEKYYFGGGFHSKRTSLKTNIRTRIQAKLGRDKRGTLLFKLPAGEGFFYS